MCQTLAAGGGLKDGNGEQKCASRFSAIVPTLQVKVGLLVEDAAAVDAAAVDVAAVDAVAVDAVAVDRESPCSS